MMYFNIDLTCCRNILYTESFTFLKTLFSERNNELISMYFTVLDKLYFKDLVFMTQAIYT